MMPANVPCAAERSEIAAYMTGLHVKGEEFTAHWQGYDLQTALQPIISFGHSRVVGFEGLVRVNDEAQKPMMPQVFLACAQDAGQLVHVDRLCRLLHMANARAASGWLFLNIHPALFESPLLDTNSAFIGAAESISARAPQRCILEVVEEAVPDMGRLTEGVARLREAGFGVALDDFGAGQSNFDRVWLIKPDVVKLDRSFAARAAIDISVRRMLPRLVSMLHEAGVLVLLEGIETREQALIAMDANIDFGQGWLFARPAAAAQVQNLNLHADIRNLWQQHAIYSEQERLQRQQKLQPYLDTISSAATLLASGVSYSDAAHSFRGLAHAQSFYVLDHSGQQVSPNIGVPQTSSFCVGQELGLDTGARWSLRPYFKRAMESRDSPQVTRPYVSISSGRSCVTVSCHTRIKGRDHVVCGDIDWLTLIDQLH